MRVVRFLCCAAVLMFVTGGLARTAAPRDALLVTPAWLAAHLGDAGLVLLHVGDTADYEAGHIPGARLVALDDVSISDREFKTTGLMLEMPPVAQLAATLAGLGIADRSRVVVYIGKTSVQTGTRVLFTLDYAGLGDRASLLDGGLAAWEREGHGRSVVPAPAATKGALSPLRVNPIVVDAAFVKAHLQTSTYAVVDARASAFYDGAQTGSTMGHPHRTGHIAGAHSVPYTTVVDADLRLKPADELTAIFTKAGVKPGDTVIAYCHIGQQATAVILAARSLGHPVLLYDGSFEDWSAHADYPVENPSKK